MWRRPPTGNSTTQLHSPANQACKHDASGTRRRYLRDPPCLQYETNWPESSRPMHMHIGPIQVWPPSGASLLPVISSSLVQTHHPPCSRKHSLSSSGPTYFSKPGKLTKHAHTSQPNCNTPRAPLSNAHGPGVSCLPRAISLGPVAQLHHLRQRPSPG